MAKTPASAKKALAPAAPKKRPGTSLASLRQDMAALAAAERQAEPVVLGNFLSVKNKQFKFQDALLDEPLTVIVLDHAFENQFFEGVYDEKNPQPPICLAVGKDETKLAPPSTDDVEGLQPQAEACQGCPHNEWASAATGKGKACKNGRKLALIGVQDPAALTADFVEKATVAYLRLSPTALRGFSGYLKRITGTLQVPLFGVLTQLSFDPASTYPSVVCTLLSAIEDEDVLAAIMAKRETVQDELLAVPSSLAPREAPAPKKSARAPAKKAPAKKAGAGGRGRF